MKKILLIAFVSLIVSQSVNAQAAKSVYFELGGPGLASFNFDTRFTPRENGIGGRVGFGGFSIDNTTALFFPLQVNYLIGKGTKHYFEVGGGATIVNINNDDADPNDDGTFNGSFGHLHFGYRLQPQDGGFLFRAGITPVFGSGDFIPYFAGVSFGYKFGRKSSDK